MGISRTRTIVAVAVQLAGRDSGVTAGELAEAAACPLRTAQRQLRSLAADGILTREIPVRIGRKRGEWRIVYRVTKSPMVIVGITPKTTDEEIEEMATQVVEKLTPKKGVRA